MGDERENLSRYLKLMRDYAETRLTGPQFEEQYLKLFKNDTSPIPDDQFIILDEVFADVDEYVADAELRQRAGGLDDKQLRRRVERALTRLAATKS